MAFYSVDMQNGVIQRVTQEYNAMDNKRFLLIEARSAKQAWAKASSATEVIGSSDCGCCRHSQCGVCEECSAGKQYSDYWICHCCGELNPRVLNVQFKEVSNGLGEN